MSVTSHVAVGLATVVGQTLTAVFTVLVVLCFAALGRALSKLR